MICKLVKASGKSGLPSAHASRLVNYILTAKSQVGDKHHDDLPVRAGERVVYYGVRNCLSLSSNDVDVPTAIQAFVDVARIADTNKKLKTSATVAHQVVSCPANEHLTNDQVDDIVESLLIAQGYIEPDGISEREYAFAAHGDTDYFHIHIIVNRYDQLSERIIDSGSTDLRKNRIINSQAAMAELEVKHNLQRHWANKLKMDTNGKCVLHDKNRPIKIKPASKPLPSGAANFEANQLEESRLSVARRHASNPDVKEAINQAKNWQALHKVLIANSLQIVPSGQGSSILVNYDIDSERDKGVKTSDVFDEPKVFKTLIDRLGEFEPPKPKLIDLWNGKKPMFELFKSKSSTKIPASNSANRRAAKLKGRPLTPFDEMITTRRTAKQSRNQKVRDAHSEVLRIETEKNRQDQEALQNKIAAEKRQAAAAAAEAMAEAEVAAKLAEDKRKRAEETAHASKLVEDARLEKEEMEQRAAELAEAKRLEQQEMLEMASEEVQEDVLEEEQRVAPQPKVEDSVMAPSAPVNNARKRKGPRR